MTLESSGSRLRDGDATDRAIAALAPWFHNLYLPSGHRTAPDHPLGDFPAFKWTQIAPVIPEDLSGLRALDIGCNAGYYSFQLASRGAVVLAIDSDEHYLRQARWAAEQLDPDRRVTFKCCELYELGRGSDRFDLVLFLGVLYHLRYPLLALDMISRLVRDRVIVQTLTMPGTGTQQIPEDLPFDQRDRLAEPGWPRAAFIEQRLAGDPTNWWTVDAACLEAMLRSSGLRVVERPGHELYVCERMPTGSDYAADMRSVELDAALGLRQDSSQRK